MPTEYSTSENHIVFSSDGAIFRPGRPDHYMLLEVFPGTVTATVGQEVIAASQRACVVLEHAGRELESSTGAFT